MPASAADVPSKNWEAEMWRILLIALVTALAVLAADSIHKMTQPDKRAGAVETAPWKASA
jgi:hypothetical protein